MVQNQCHCPPHTYYVQLIIVVQNFSHSYRLQLAQHLQRGNNSRSTINYMYIPGFGIQSCVTTNHSIKGFGVNRYHTKAPWLLRRRNTNGKDQGLVATELGSQVDSPCTIWFFHPVRIQPPSSPMPKSLW
jgi:hypothetical protein